MRMPKAQALMFNLADDARTRRVEDYLIGTGVAVRHIRAEEQGETIGFLLGMESFEKSSTRSFEPRFSEELLLMSGFSQERLNAFLRFFKAEGIARIELKAMLTPSNVTWTALELYRHMTQERAALQSRRGGRK